MKDYIQLGVSMLAIERLSDIEAKYAELVQRIELIELDDETLRLMLYLGDGINLRIAEQWQGDNLKR